MCEDKLNGMYCEDCNFDWENAAADEVNIKELKKIANVSHIGYPSVAVNRLKRFYCPKISRMGKCDEPCHQSEFCRMHIRNIISSDYKGAKIP